MASSPIIFNAGQNVTVDLVIGGDVIRGPPEYESLVREISPLLQGQHVTLADLAEDEAHQDVTFISSETGRDPEHMAFLIVAHRLAKQYENKVEAEIFYGLFREGLPTQISLLLSLSPDIKRQAIKDAVGENIISAHFGEETDDILERLKGLTVMQALEPPKEEGKATLAQLLGTVLPEGDPQAKSEFLKIYVNHSGPIEEFWKGLEDNPRFKDKVENLQFTLQLGALTKNHLPLVKEIHEMQHQNRITISA